MSQDKSASGIYFVKRMPHFEVIKKIRRMSDRRVLDLLLDWQAVERRNTWRIEKPERVRMGVQLGISEHSVANSLANLSKPQERGGVEILVRKGRGKYMMNPEYYFYGDQQAHNDAIESYHDFRRNRIIQSERKKTKSKKKAFVVPLSLVK